MITKYLLSLAVGTMLISSLLVVFATTDVFATKKSPYDSGFDHGCSDAHISNPDDRYINQYEKGPAFHTNEFMRGYNSGYDDCSGEDNVLERPGQAQSQASNNENNNENNNANTQSQSQTTKIYICNDKGCTVQ